MTKISWTAPEYIHYPKSPVWFTTLFVAGFGLSLYFLLRRDFLAGLLFILLVIIIFYFARTKPKLLEIEIQSKGIKLGDLDLSWQQIKSFWIVYEPPAVKTLNFETTAYLNRFLTVQLGEADPVQVREFLLEYLPEDLDKNESLSDKLARRLKF